MRLITMEYTEYLEDCAQSGRLRYCHGLKYTIEYLLGEKTEEDKKSLLYGLDKYDKEVVLSLLVRLEDHINTMN